MAFLNVARIIIDPTKCGTADSTNFPMLVSGTYPYLATVGNNGQVTNSNGYDIGFYADAALNTKLNWETVTYTAASGAVVYWVQVPTLSHTLPTHVYMAYGNSAISTDQSNKTGTWDSNYKGVWHFEENAATTTVNDSTGNSNAAGTASANTSTLTSSGNIGNGLAFSSTTGYVTLTGALLTTGQPLTISWWEKVAADTNVFPSRFILSTSGGAHYLIFRVKTPQPGYAYLSWGPDPVSTTPGCFHDASAPSPLSSIGVWTHFCVTATTSETTTPANTSVYVNGVSHTVSQTSGDQFNTVSQNRIGYDGADNGPDATMDEPRVSSGIARSVSWALAEYNNQSSPSTFYTIDNQGGYGVGDSGWNGEGHFIVGNGMGRSEWAN